MWSCFFWVADFQNLQFIIKQTNIDFEWSSLDHAQCLRREVIEIYPVPLEASNNELEELVCKALSLTRNEVCPDDLEACHRLKKKENVIVKFKKQKV